MRVIYILASFMIFTLSLCYHYYQDTALSSNSLTVSEQKTVIKKVNNSINIASDTIYSVKVSDVYSREKMLTLISYIDQYKSAESLNELENKHSMNDYSVIMNIIHFYAKKIFTMDAYLGHLFFRTYGLFKK